MGKLFEKVCVDIGKLVRAYYGAHKFIMIIGHRFLWKW